MKKASIAVAAAAAGMGIATPSAAQDQDPIKVGMIDVGGGDLTFRDQGTIIEHRDFVSQGSRPASRMTRTGRENGVMTASAFVRQARWIDPDAPVRIYSANVFQEQVDRGQAGSPRRISVNWEGARQAVQWFKQNDVKVVIASFNGADSPEMRAFMEETKKNGMTVFAGSGNSPGGSAFPAMHPDAVSVGADNEGHAYRTDPPQATWVNFTMNGGVPMRREGREVDAGTSYATAKAAALGAYYARTNPEVTPETMRNTLASVAISVEYQDGERVTQATRLDDVVSAEEMRALITREQAGHRARNFAMNQAAAAQSMGR